MFCGRTQRSEFGTIEGRSVLDDIFLLLCINIAGHVGYTRSVMDFDNAGAFFTNAVYDNVMEFDEFEEYESVEDGIGK